MIRDKEKIQKEIEQRLLQRFSALGLTPGSKTGNREESAFLSGAMSALQAIFGDESPKGLLTDYAKPLYIFGPLSGRSVVEELLNEKAKGGA